METKKLLIGAGALFLVSIFGIIIAIIISVALGYSKYSDESTGDPFGDNKNRINGSISNDIDTGIKYQETVDDQTVELNYLGGNKWEYKLIGYKPTACYTSDLDILIAESYPERVTITMVIKPSELDVNCTQAIAEVEETGTINVSEGATFEFLVDHQR